jgi:hypothetical protein
MSVLALSASRAARLAGLATAALMASVLGATFASASVICSSPGLPPACGVYRTPAEVHAAFANPDPAIIEAILKDATHDRFLNIIITPLGPDELEEFDSRLSALVDVDLGPGGVLTDIPLSLTGPVTVLTTGKTGNTTGTFDTEIIAMSLAGTLLGLPIEIRESPTQNSTGQTTITDLGGGSFAFDSFFDIWIELSVNGGPFVPQTGGSSTVNLVDSVPEPATGLLLAIGLGAFASWRRHGSL